MNQHVSYNVLNLNKIPTCEAKGYDSELQPLAGQDAILAILIYS